MTFIVCGLRNDFIFRYAKPRQENYSMSKNSVNNSSFNTFLFQCEINYPGLTPVVFFCNPTSLRSSGSISCPSTRLGTSIAALPLVSLPNQSFGKTCGERSRTTIAFLPDLMVGVSCEQEMKRAPGGRNLKGAFS